MRPRGSDENLFTMLTSGLKSLTMLVIAVPGRRVGARIIVAFRDAGAVSRSTAQRYRPSSADEEAALRGLLESEIIRQPEVGHFYLDEEALDAWLGWGWRKDR